MRAIEKQRLEQLRAKKVTEDLTDSESARLYDLERKEENERGKSGNEGSRSGGDAGNNPAGGDQAGESGTAGGEEGSGILIGDSGTQTGDVAPIAGGTDGNGLRPGGIGSGVTGTPSDAGSGKGSGNGGNRARNRASSQPRSAIITDGTTGGSVGNSGDLGTQSESGGLADLSEKPSTTPKKDVTPKRKGKTPDAKTVHKSGALSAEVIAMLIQGGFGMVAGALDREHWNVSEAEAISVADPLETIIENLTPKQKKVIEKYSAPVMLGFALIGIVLPRMMQDAHESKNRRRIQPNVQTQKRSVEASPQNDINTASNDYSRGITPSDQISVTDI